MKKQVEPIRRILRWAFQLSQPEVLQIDGGKLRHESTRYTTPHNITPDELDNILRQHYKTHIASP